MKRDWNINKKEELKTELRNEFPNLTDEEMNTINGSYERLIDSISSKTNKDRNTVQRIVEEKVEYINSKHLL